MPVLRVIAWCQWERGPPRGAAALCRGDSLRSLRGDASESFTNNHLLFVQLCRSAVQTFGCWPWSLNFSLSAPKANQFITRANERLQWPLTLEHWHPTGSSWAILPSLHFCVRCHLTFGGSVFSVGFSPRTLPHVPGNQQWLVGESESKNVGRVCMFLNSVNMNVLFHYRLELAFAKDELYMTPQNKLRERVKYRLFSTNEKHINLTLILLSRFHPATQVTVLSSIFIRLFEVGAREKSPGGVGENWKTTEQLCSLYNDHGHTQQLQSSVFCRCGYNFTFLLNKQNLVLLKNFDL